MEYDPFLTTPEPSNPWTSDDPSFWDLEARYKTRNHSSVTLTASEHFYTLYKLQNSVYKDYGNHCLFLLNIDLCADNF